MKNCLQKQSAEEARNLSGNEYYKKYVYDNK